MKNYFIIASCLLVLISPGVSSAVQDHSRLDPLLFPATRTAYFHGSVYPRTITPNNDGINDQVFFFFKNETSIDTVGSVYDLGLSKVADIHASSLFVQGLSVLMWDGKDRTGSVVRSGVYLYQVKVGEEWFSGTVVVVK